LKNVKPEKWEIKNLNDNKVLERFMDIDYSKYIKEEDVTMPFVEDWRNIKMPPLPDLGRIPDCPEAWCRLGCICDSLKRQSDGRSDCGNRKCFFECCCKQSKISRNKNEEKVKKFDSEMKILRTKMI
jgi:hypothetical protein